jgi:hypothetical protein
VQTAAAVSRRTRSVSSLRPQAFNLRGVTWSVQPEPDDEAQRDALIAALERALAEEEAAASGVDSAWWRSGLDTLGGSPASEKPWGEPRVVEP